MDSKEDTKNGNGQERKRDETSLFANSSEK